MSADHPDSPPTYCVRLLPSRLAYSTATPASLLTSGLQAGIRLPHSCRNGTCRTCLCTLKEGKIRYLIDWPGLTREEKQEGLILPCVAVAMSDLLIVHPDVVSVMPPADDEGGSDF